MAEEAKHCVHFRSMQNDTCKADVRFDTFNEVKFYDKPCFGGIGAVCAKYEARGMENVLKRFDQFEASFKRLDIARKAIIKETGGKRGLQGTIACPVCATGQLRYSVANYNGHIHAKCSTDKCVAWIE